MKCLPSKAKPIGGLACNSRRVQAPKCAKPCARPFKVERRADAVECQAVYRSVIEAPPRSFGDRPARAKRVKFCLVETQNVIHSEHLGLCCFLRRSNALLSYKRLCATVSLT